MSSIYLAGTADTKGDELAYLHDILTRSYANVLRVDLGTRAPKTEMDIPARDVAACHPDGADRILGTNDRGAAMNAMGVAFERFCKDREDDIAGIIGIGGGGGTSIVTAGMRQLPYGVPKVMVSTLASGDVAPYVDVSDIIMFPSVTDIAGLNRLSRVILHNAAQALLGMVGSPPPEQMDDKPAIGLSMFGVTTQSVTAISAALQESHDCLVFHATGTGGRAMERLAAGGILSGLIDITTTEICDLLFGGVLPANRNRLDVVAQTRIPYVGSVGALDMVNFWAPDTVPERYRDRKLYCHNSNVTLMRTTAEECGQLGRWIGHKLNACEGPVRFLIPQKGVSALDIEGGDFWDRAADSALFEALETTVVETELRRITILPHHINDPEFSAAAAAAFLEICQN
ncbi:Tm-1-like ATP-binding domain-containing protein [Hoeflea sp. TYP-13]|uniref:Tm-1-like ATP-binding domain-containing protein n=1 Tax=Hoeflea sp. TYP-13 TaxID=3230023 RepID=UPI0034C5C0F6